MDLTPTEQALMLALLDLDDFRDAWGVSDRPSREELGRVMGISGEAVRQIEGKALHKMRLALVRDPQLLHELQQIIYQLRQHDQATH